MRPICSRFAFVLFLAIGVFGENGAEAWLRYAPLEPAVARQYSRVPARILILDNSALLKSAQSELVRGVRGMLGRTLRISTGVSTEPVIIVGTVEQIRKLDAGFEVGGDLAGDGYAI